MSRFKTTIDYQLHVHVSTFNFPGTKVFSNANTFAFRNKGEHLREFISKITLETDQLTSPLLQ